MGGDAASCPGCEDLLAIPAEEDDTPPIGFSGNQYVKASRKEGEKDLEKRHREYKHVRESKDWAIAPQDLRDKGLKVMTSVIIFSIIIIGGLVFLMLTDSKEGKDEIINSGFIENNALIGKIDQDTSEEEGYIYDPEDKDKVEELEKFLGGMFAAKTIDEMLSYVRPVKGIREKMVHFYKGEQLPQSPFFELLSVKNITDSPGYLFFECQTKNYKTHAGFLSYTEDKILLDWESYVGYSEMSWEELAKNKPTKPVRLRVSGNLSQYYNEEFANEKDWQSVALTNPSEREAIYGYVKRGSAAYQELFNFGLSNNRKVILEVYFPKGAKEGNQVFVERVVQQGWLNIKEK